VSSLAHRPAGKAALVLGLLGLLALLAAAGAFALWRHAQNTRGFTRVQLAPEVTGAAGLERLPARPDDVASQALDPIAADAARELNAKIPFAETKPLPARSFRFIGTATDRARALDCLALAALAEAGGSDPGQRAVIQVVLNRVRHPAFAKTVCGVVFQGSERTTGCQFSFTCDGALTRRYSDAAWAAARQRAVGALDGAVFAPVGAATHYHTDWVHPVWSSQLDKIARIETHLFFRWPGYWGSRDAGRVAYAGNEPGIAQLAWLPSHAAAAATEPGAIASEAALAAAIVSVATRKAGDQVGIGTIAAAHKEGGAYLVHLSAGPTQPAAISLGRRLCGGRGYCRVMGWTDKRAVPKTFPIPPEARARLSFSYVLDASNAEYIYFDCTQFKDVARDSCLPPAR
jgi:spore germination cell wall hydrolase CwlJ-like protein